MDRAFNEHSGGRRKSFSGDACALYLASLQCQFHDESADSEIVRHREQDAFRAFAEPSARIGMHRQMRM